MVILHDQLCLKFDRKFWTAKVRLWKSNATRDPTTVTITTAAVNPMTFEDNLESGALLKRRRYLDVFFLSILILSTTLLISIGSMQLQWQLSTVLFSVIWKTTFHVINMNHVAEEQAFIVTSDKFTFAMTNLF